MIYKIEGDVTKPDFTTSDVVIIAHVCNNLGGWGAGVSGSIGRAFPAAKQYYLGFMACADEFSIDCDLLLGKNLVVNVDSNLVVVNMIAQNGYASVKNPVAIDMHSLEVCLIDLYNWAKYVSKENSVSIHLPKIGSGLGGGNWDEILECIEKYATIDTYIYEYIPASSR